MSLSLAHNYNLQQLYMYLPHTDIPDNFMTSVSAHGGLTHVIMHTFIKRTHVHTENSDSYSM